MPLIKIPSDRLRWEQLSYLMGCMTVTGRIEGIGPQSLLIVGPSSAGKSAMINRYNQAGVNTHLMFLTAISMMGLQSVLRERVPKVTHLMIPEFQSLVLRKKSVWEGLLGLLLPAMEEGVGELYNGPRLESYHGARLGLVSGITHSAFLSVLPQLSESGFLSRVLVCHLNRSSVDALLARQAANAGDVSELRKIVVNLPSRPFHVRISSRLADAIDVYAHGVDPNGIHRTAKRFAGIVKAAAWLDGKSEVSDRHWDFIRSLEELWIGDR